MDEHKVLPYLWRWDKSSRGIKLSHFSAALRKSNAGSFVKCTHFSWCSFPSMHEVRRASTTVHAFILSVLIFPTILEELTWGAGPNNTANPVTEACTVEQLCAFNGKLKTSSSSFTKAMDAWQVFKMVYQTNGSGMSLCSWPIKLLILIIADLSLPYSFMPDSYTFSSIWSHNGFFPDRCVLPEVLVNGSYYWQVERDMGSGGFLLTYFAAGIFG